MKLTDKQKVWNSIFNLVLIILLVIVTYRVGVGIDNGDNWFDFVWGIGVGRLATLSIYKLKEQD